MDSSYRSQPDPNQAPCPSSYDPRSHYPSSYQQDASFREPQRPRSPASSKATNDGYPQPSQQPLHNALKNAFDKSDSAGKVDPQLIAQITAEVKKSVLDEIKLGMGVTAQQPVAPPQYPPQSPISMTSIPSRNVYTPPSPKQADLCSHGSASPDPLSHDTLFDGAGDTPTPKHERSAPVDILRERPIPRPAAPPRMPTESDLTPIERRWQRLFDPQGQPTPRLGEFLRGLAIHLIDDYEPKKSLVITPSKMLRFYNDVKLTEEIYPWDTIFGKLPYSTLCKIYRDMRCEHHLIQEHTAAQPDIPALTPQGFQEWMTAMIQSYPDAEYERLSRAVLDMPISNADDCKERFPKELPRRLFPHIENLQAQQRCAAALSPEGVGPLRRAPTFPPPPPMSQSASVPPSLERERSPYTSRPDPRAVVSEDEDNVPISLPLERERKPYAAAPGGGKVYEDDTSRSAPSEVPLHEQRRRTQSTASQHPYVPPDPSQYPRSATQTNGRRPRSPSFSNYGKSSDPNVSGGYYTSHMYDENEEKRRFGKDAETRREWAVRQADHNAGHQRRSTAGTDGSYDSQPRSVYDDDYYRGRGGTNGYDSRSGYDSWRY
ncbi:uncharacterized protein N0V89_004383 [Didymosphaeria variabile]|uniref:DUF7514 domain-containing protein n=1 Tax=Didymosphaeria variabile TaxID=1932322 RepID=A0A9W9CDI7_9PLEO|nr:uncharacterized protein N0V89_004383 [Didymosphaeria variabile]KAJ4356351.1 hypothetical protein N0V89_004383 [Didymosphaeria variabile]